MRTFNYCLGFIAVSTMALAVGCGSSDDGDPGPVGTGGSVGTTTGGVTSTTGGVTSSTGGFTTSTGGFTTSTGGVASTTGGAGPGQGGQGQAGFTFGGRSEAG